VDVKKLIEAKKLERRNKRNRERRAAGESRGS
jgi:hypothetical protein